jgi:hypothetical protein
VLSARPKSAAGERERDRGSRSRTFCSYFLRLNVAVIVAIIGSLIVIL